MNGTIDLLPMARQLTMMCSGFRNEMVVAWSIFGRSAGDPVFVAAGDEDHVTVVPVRVFRHAVTARADGVVIAHNHPRPTGPSEADRAVTRRLVAAGQVVAVPLVAHLVVEPGVIYELVAGTSFRPEPPRIPGHGVAA